jgi:hypothetical protein
MLSKAVGVFTSDAIQSAYKIIGTPEKNTTTDMPDDSPCFRANTSRTEELLARNQRLGRPILNVGLPKCGSTTLTDFFTCAGMKTSQAFTDRDTNIGLCMRSAFESGKRIIASCDTWVNINEARGSKNIKTTLDHDVEAIMQMDVVRSPTECVFPQISYLDQIHEEHPNATFILNFHPVQHWLKSMVNWSRNGERMQERLTECDLPGLPKGVGKSAEELKRWLCGHVNNMRNFVAEHPSHALIELDLYDNDRNAKLMAGLFRAKESCWGHSNLSKKGTTRNDLQAIKMMVPSNPGARPSAVRAYARPKTNLTAVICAVGKHEAPYIDEWTDYHLALGFASIYIYDNTDRFELEQWGHNRHDRGENVFVFHNPGWRSQCKAYYNCANSMIRKGHKWALFIDLDEFLILKKHSHVVDFASEYVEDGHLGINWRLFGTSDLQNYEPIPVTKRFQYRVPEDYSKNTFIKSFVRLNAMNLSSPCFDPHILPRKVGRYLKDTNGTKFSTSRHRGPTDVAVIYHFYFKSKEEYISKRSRGAGHLGMHQSLVKEAIAGLDPVNRNASIPNGTIFDDTAWQMIKKMVPKYALYDKFLQ